MNKKRVIVTGGTKDDVAPIAVFAMNVKETNSHLFSKLVVFHDGISRKDQDKINSIISTEFIRYRLPFETKNDIVANYFSPMLFCKYECFRLLEKYDEVVWSDYDVLIKTKLDEICDFHIAPINIVVDGKTVREMFYSEIHNKDILNYDLDKEGLCTPLFSLSKSIDKYISVYKWCCEKTEEYDEDLRLAEQCIFSLALQEFGIAYNSLDSFMYACHPRDDKGQARILHSYGQPKFWNGLKNEEWESMYKKWIAMGGTPYYDKRKKIWGKVRLIFSRLNGIRARQ